jgi:ribosome-associated heat shock protein Hsp15
LRIDKWLWAARFFKTRSLAQQAVAGGRVQLNGERTKRAHEVRVGDSIDVRVGEWRWQIQVKALSERRGPAEEARRLYEETPESRAERERRQDLRRWGAEPAASLKGRPTKRDRRLLEGLPVLDSDPADDGEA